MATPADPRGEKIFHFLQVLGGEKLLEKCWSIIFKRPERGLNNFCVSDRSFFGSFFAFFKPFFVPNEKFGAISFCRRAALTCLDTSRADFRGGDAMKHFSVKKRGFQ